ncbi:BRO family protein [Klebsiella sp. CN_Kp118]|uniref:BRO-N domain-containing protein n=1 Tax=Klebsiella sp. CN_Kp118 TaxID=3153432 RepID=UPI0032B40E38
MSELTIFSFQENHPVRVQVINGEPWFCLKDVCDVLSISRTSDLVQVSKGFVKNEPLKSRGSLDPKGVRKTDTLTNGGQQQIPFINEPNLYRVIFRSNKPEARQFQDWVFNEVLPAIRKNGEYSYVEPVPKCAGEPLDWRQKRELQGLINDIAQSFRYHNAWISGVWLALRRACRNPAPNPITVDDLPAIVAELRRILEASETALENMRTYEREFLRNVVRGGHKSISCEELPITDLGSEVEKVLPAHFELAINKLEKLSAKLPTSTISS